MKFKKRTLRFAYLLFLIWVSGGVGGCTFKYVKPEVSAPPEKSYGSLAVGNIDIYDKLWDYLVPHFRRGLLQELKKHNAFETIQEIVPETLPESSLLLTGRITEVNKGNAALRWIVGFGAGKATVRGVFEISDFRGTLLARFEAGESYAGGAGIGGASFLDMEDLMRRFGETVAKRAIQWAQGAR